MYGNVSPTLTLKLCHVTGTRDLSTCEASTPSEMHDVESVVAKTYRQGQSWHRTAPFPYFPTRLERDELRCSEVHGLTAGVASNHAFCGSVTAHFPHNGHCRSICLHTVKGRDYDEGITS